MPLKYQYSGRSYLDVATSEQRIRIMKAKRRKVFTLLSVEENLLGLTCEFNANLVSRPV